MPQKTDASGLDKTEYPYILTSTKNGYYCHSQHRNLVSLRKRAPYPVVELSTGLARKKGIEDGNWVRLSTAAGSARFRARLVEDMAADVVIAEFGWWQACDEIGLRAAPIRGDRSSNFSNLATGETLDPISGSAPLRSIPCEIGLDPGAAISTWHGFRDFIVISIDEEAEGVRSIVLSAEDGGLLPDYLPGQYVTFQAASQGAEMRSYSLTGSAFERDRHSYSIAVRHVRSENGSGTGEGAVSTYIHRTMTVGERVSLRAPGGDFVMPMQCRQPVVLFAAGIGITPFLSYLETLATQSAVPEIHLFYANRGRRTHAFRRRIAELRERVPGLNLCDFYTVPEQAGPEIHGRLTADVVDDDLIRRRARFYFCGPEAMMNSVGQQLVARGVPPFDLFREVFRSPSAPKHNPGQKFAVTFSRAQRTIEWTPDMGVLLSLAEQQGISIPSGCRVGQCESCSVRVISGDVDHVSGDAPEERDMCFACQAIPASDVTIDA